MAIATHDGSGLSSDRRHKDQVIGWVRQDGMDRLVGDDDMRWLVEPCQDQGQRRMRGHRPEFRVAEHSDQLVEKVGRHNDVMPAVHERTQNPCWRACPADRRKEGVRVQDDPHRRLARRMASSTTVRGSFSFRTSALIAWSASFNLARAACSSMRRSRSYSSWESRTACSVPRRPIRTGSPDEASATSFPSFFLASSTGTYLVGFTLRFILQIA